MKITANEEYGLRVILQLYKIIQQKSSKCDAIEPEINLVTLNEIAAAEHISADYAAQILLKLRRGNIVESVRGKKGGYKLSRVASEITLFEVMQALSDEAFADDFCQNHTGNDKICIHNSECSIRPVWSTISSMVNDYFKSIKLEDLLDTELGVKDLIKVRTHCHQ